jgi:phosphoribosylformylglycinamidine cyclo-ligase
MDNRVDKKTSYQDAGIDIEKGNELIRRLKETIDNTHRKGVIGGLGGFGGLFDLGSLKYKQPILVSGTDGVGTKIKLAIENNMHDTIGIDLVAMCVNDIIVQGAKPLFFLDYFACSKLDINIAETVINGIGVGCSLAECSLIGGETAEMPGMYKEQDYDLAGFCVGVVEKDEMITGKNVAAGDVLIAIASSGCHSNGYSLIRKILNDTNADLSQVIDGKKLLDHLLTPTRIYVKQILNLMQHISIKSLAHITGGGLIENLPRVIPKDLSVIINTDTWNLPPIFAWLSEQGKINSDEMFKTFNCGIGLVLCVERNNADKTINYLNDNGETAWVIGSIIKNNGGTKVQIK